MKDIFIVLPSYEPDQAMLGLAGELSATGYRVIIVNDGSGCEYNMIFDEARSILGAGCIYLSYENNRGKGFALKTAFRYILDNFPDAIGAVTADCDGQHTVDAIKSAADALKKTPDALILGVRSFDEEYIPWKSALGNRLCNGFMSAAAGIKIKDTQCGLRGIPRPFMKKLTEIRANGFEFETEMLLEASKTMSIIELPVKTIYIDNNTHTHFRPVADTLKIGVSICRSFLKYALSSIASSAVDLFAFWLWCGLLPMGEGVALITSATILARIISLSFNFVINHKLVFRSVKNMRQTFGRYLALAVLQMLASACLVSIGAKMLGPTFKVFIKWVVDTLLFFISFMFQRSFVFRDR